MDYISLPDCISLWLRLGIGIQHEHILDSISQPPLFRCVPLPLLLLFTAWLTSSWTSLKSSGTYSSHTVLSDPQKAVSALGWRIFFLFLINVLLMRSQKGTMTSHLKFRVDSRLGQANLPCIEVVLNMSGVGDLQLGVVENHPAIMPSASRNPHIPTPAVLPFPCSCPGSNQVGSCRVVLWAIRAGDGPEVG